MLRLGAKYKILLYNSTSTRAGKAGEKRAHWLVLLTCASLCIARTTRQVKGNPFHKTRDPLPYPKLTNSRAKRPVTKTNKTLTSSSTLERPTARNLFLSCACILDIKLRSISAGEASAR